MLELHLQYKPQRALAHFDMNLGQQIISLFLIALPIACVAWTVTHEEIFREPREWCQQKSATCQKVLQRKFFYLFTCEYCFSHYVTIFFLVLTRFKLLYADWRGYLMSLFALVWVANTYMNLYSRIRLDLKHERLEIKEKEKTIEALEPEPPEFETARRR